MVRYLLKKIIILLFSLFFIVTLTFILMKAIPGDPFIQEQNVPEEILNSLYKHYGLDQPIYIQYLKYIKGFLTFNLGPSFLYEGRTVNQIIYEGFPVSLILGVQALFIAVLFGITLGCIAAIFQNKLEDSICLLLSIFLTAIPTFLLATLLQYVFAMKLNLLPVAQWGSFSHWILPVLSLSGMPLAFIARLTRTNMVEILKQDYIKTALAKGLPYYKIIIKHALRNALIPILAYLGHVATFILTGSFVIEKIFAISGLGGWLISSIMNRDYTVIMGLTVFYSAFLLLLVFFIDLSYALLDPKIKITEK